MKIKVIVCLCVFFFTFKNELYISQTVKIGKIELANSDLKGSIDDRFTFKEIQEYLEANKGWRLPTVDELILIYENKNKLVVNGNFYLAHGLNSENNLSSGILYTYNNAYRKYFYIDFFKSKLELKENSGGIDYYIRLVRSNDNQNINNNMSSNIAKSTGCLKGDCYYGYGELVRPSGLTYKGYFKDGYRHGKGYQKYPQGDIYDGDWVNDQPYGKGIYKYTNGNIFEGGVANGLKWGKGKFTILQWRYI